MFTTMEIGFSIVVADNSYVYIHKIIWLDRNVVGLVIYMSTN